jgi:NADH:ubiquinone oxidoreductase subunit E
MECGTVAHELEQLIAENASQPGALLLIAEKLMDRYQAIPTRALSLLQQQLGISATEIQSILSFYHYPVTQQPVKCLVEVCCALSCYLKNSDNLLQQLCKAFSVEANRVSSDGRLLISTVNCLSFCEQGPALTVNGKQLAFSSTEDVVAHIRSVLE